MLKLSRQFINIPLLSLRIGRPVAQALQPIINPNNLTIVGWFCKESLTRSELILQTSSVREVATQGLVIDDVDELRPLEDLVRMQKVVDLCFELVGKTVVNTSKKRLGKVTDYAVEPRSMLIKKLYVNQNLLRSIGGSGRVIDRTQIVEITDKKIVVKGTEDRAMNQVAQAATEPV